MEDCFARAGLETPRRERTRLVVGLSLVEAMRAMLPDADPEFHRALAEDYKLAFQRLRGNGLVDEPLYEGIAELVEGLGAEGWLLRSEEHTSELQSLMRSSYAVFCLKKKKKDTKHKTCKKEKIASQKKNRT